MLIRDDQVTGRFGPKVGVVEITGVITESRDTLKSLAEFSEEDSVKAVVVRIDSPGGSVGAVQEIYREIMKLRGRKKTAASLGTAAASGGYYIASACERIFSNPGTLTGSIGAVMQIPDVEGVMDLLKLRVTTVKSGRFKDSGSMTRALSPDEQNLFQDLVAEVHQQFINDIAKGRGRRPEDISTAADGRIFTGARAMEMGLVDEMGGEKDALEWAAKAAGIPGKPNVVRGRKRQALVRELLESLAGGMDDLSSRAGGFKLLFK
jgi:protease-4